MHFTDKIRFLSFVWFGFAFRRKDESVSFLDRCFRRTTVLHGDPHNQGSVCVFSHSLGVYVYSRWKNTLNPKI